MAGVTKRSSSGSEDEGEKRTDPVRGSKPRPGLYVVATPIGNLRDITLRALDLLHAADVIACEDTRVTARLAAAYGLRAKLVPYHDHNAARQRPVLLRELAAGRIVALVSDAGTPLVADPGFRLVREALAGGHHVSALPGPSAALMALTLSDLPSDRFMFGGFLPEKPGERRRLAGELAAVPATLILFEAARRLPESLADLAEVLGDRPAAVARELTKIYEEVRRGGLASLARAYAEEGAPKGEVVLVIGPPTREAALAGPEALDALLREALSAVGFKQAVADVAARTGQPRRIVYARALKLQGEARGGDEPA